MVFVLQGMSNFNERVTLVSRIIVYNGVIKGGKYKLFRVIFINEI